MPMSFFWCLRTPKRGVCAPLQHHMQLNMGEDPPTLVLKWVRSFDLLRSDEDLPSLVEGSHFGEIRDFDEDPPCLVGRILPL